jgi:hypothetical protein
MKKYSNDLTKLEFLSFIHGIYWYLSCGEYRQILLQDAIRGDEKNWRAQYNEENGII